MIAAFGLAASATATWFLRVVFTRVQRRFRDKISVALEAHVATLQASGRDDRAPRAPRVPRPPGGAARSGVRARPPLHVAVLDVRLDHPARRHAPPARVGEPDPRVPSAVRDPDHDHQHLAARRRTQGARSRSRRTTGSRNTSSCSGTTAPAGKELRVEGIGGQLVHDRRESWDQWYHPIAHARTITALWHTLAWALFGGAYVGAIVYVAAGLARQSRRRAARRRRRQPPLAVRRCGRRRARLPARDLARLRHAGWRGSRTTRRARPASPRWQCPSASRAASGSSTCRSPTRARITTRSPT